MNFPARIDIATRQAGFTAEDFVAMIEANAFADIVGKVELVDGVITRMAPAMTPHFWYQRQLFLALHEIFGEGLDGWIAGQEPTVRIGPRTVRDPDIAIIRRPESIERIIFDRLDVLLVAEVSDATLRHDKGRKRLSYARGGIANYWVVDINGRKVLTWAQSQDGDYREADEVPFGAPLAVPGTDRTITLT